MKALYLITMLYLAINAGQLQAPPAAHPAGKTVSLQKYTVKIINVGAAAYGYEIYAANKLLIRQTAIPAIPGNKAFQKKADAQKVASLVVTKLSRGIMPPTVEKQEMDKLHIQY